jgi:hypothetical protein
VLEAEDEVELPEAGDATRRRSAGSRFVSLLRVGEVAAESSSSSASRVLTYSAHDFWTSDRVRGLRSSRSAAKASKQ